MELDWHLSDGVFELITVTEKELGKHIRKKMDSCDVGVRGIHSV